MNTRKTTTKSLAEVAAFVNRCNDDRFADSRSPFPEQIQEESGVVFHEFHENYPLPLAPNDIDRLAEEWQHRRKVFPKESYHE